MSNQYFTSNSLIRSIKRRALIPTSQSTFQDEDLLEFANEEISLGLLPSIMQHHEDYFLYTETVPTSTDTLRYTIPYRAIGNKLRELAFQDANGNIFEMTRIPIDYLPDYAQNFSSTSLAVYYIENNEVVMTPRTNLTLLSNGKLRFSYYLRPNMMVTEDRVAIIQSINTTTGQLVLDKIPSNFNLDSTTTYDFIQARSPHRTLCLNKTATTIVPGSKTIQFNPTDLPTTLLVGDHVALAEETIIPQIPSDLHVILAHRVSVRCLEALGDAQGVQLANQKLAEMEQNTATLIDNRVEASPQKVVNRHGLLRSGLARKRFRSRIRGY